MRQVQPSNDSAITFPIAVLDFEASALATSSYPIEVGLAVARSRDGVVDVWSSLIRPADNWDIDAQWDPDAERLHGISRWDIRSGITPREAMLALNRLTAGCSPVWCDGGQYDVAWLETLSTAAMLPAQFELRDISVLLGTDTAMIECYRKAIARSQAPHRAGPDALRICHALITTLRGHGDV